MLGPGHLLATYGVAGIGIVLFLETGVLLGLLLPGETLTVLAGAFSHSTTPASRTLSSRW